MDLQQHFEHVRQLIRRGRSNALQAAYTEQLNAYWQVGAYIYYRLQNAEWGEKTVEHLAAWLKENEPTLKGFDRRSIYRMKEFFQTWHELDWKALKSIQVGMQDYFLDLLFFHRELRCLVAFELKITSFKPEYLGKLNFYLEALDREVKKPHENPSIGVLLCTAKNKEVVEFALSRNISPALIAEYETKLIDKNLLRRMLHEWTENIVT